MYEDPGQTEGCPTQPDQRGDMRYDNQAGYIHFGCVRPDYLPGTVSLAPAILVSKTGEKGTWR